MNQNPTCLNVELIGIRAAVSAFYPRPGGRVTPDKSCSAAADRHCRALDAVEALLPSRRLKEVQTPPQQFQRLPVDPKGHTLWLEAIPARDETISHASMWTTWAW